MAQVLVVDDSSTMRSVVSSFLSSHGFDVTVASDGREGLSRLREDPAIKLVVSDVNMPNMDGLTMAEKIRTELGNSAVRIVMLTTEANPSLRQRGKELGVTGWIVKPFRGELVLAPFRRLCADG
jgi:two-component system chemotaxis response regulator CheY